MHDRLGRRVSFILLWDIFQSRPNARDGLCSLYQRFDDYILFQEAKDPIRSIFDAWLHSLDRHDTALKSSHGILSTWNKNKIKSAWTRIRGGGARGCYEVGAWQAFRECNIHLIA